MDMELLQKKIEDSGLKQKYLAEQLGISRFGFAEKMKNPDRWKVVEVVKMTKVLNLSKSESKKIFGL